MRNTWKYWVGTLKGRYDVGCYYDFKNFKVYSAYKDYIVSDVYRKAYNESFTGQFLKAGFDTYGYSIGLVESGEGGYIPTGKRGWYKKPINPIDNWFGTSLQAPDTLFVKGDSFMIMSLQGATVNDGRENGYDVFKKYKELFQAGAVKYILIQKGDKVLYETWTGELPPKEIVQQIL